MIITRFATLMTNLAGFADRGLTRWAKEYRACICLTWTVKGDNECYKWVKGLTLVDVSYYLNLSEEGGWVTKNW